MKKSTLSFICFLIGSTCLQAADFKTKGDNTTYTFQKLSELPESGVTREGDRYVVNGSCTISVGDQFTIDNAAVIAFADNAELIIEGAADLRATTPTTLTRYGESSSCYGIDVKDDEHVTEVSNLTFEYVGLRGSGKEGMNVNDCHFLYHNGSSSGALYLGCDGAPFRVTNCTFEQCQRAAIGGAANYYCPITVEDCLLRKNSQDNRNIPQLNLTAGSEIIIRNCIVEGDPTLTMVGGIGVSNFLGATGIKVTVENCDIHDNRYGITTVGSMDVRIIGNSLVNNQYEVNPNNGGSGISLYDPTGTQTAYISGNHIEKSLWGITVIGCGEVNLGKTEVSPDALDYNPGNNVFVDNGNSGVLYDLYNNSTRTIYAQGNIWNATVQDAEHIEEVIFHKNDNSLLGEVIFMPAGDPASIGTITRQVPSTGIVHRLDGTIVRANGSTPLPHGLYIIDGKKVVK